MASVISVLKALALSARVVMRAIVRHMLAVPMEIARSSPGAPKATVRQVRSARRVTVRSGQIVLIRVAVSVALVARVAPAAVVAEVALPANRFV